MGVRGTGLGFNARLRSTRGFTLIELLVVILIIGVLVALAAPSFLGQTSKAHDSAAKQQLAVAYRAAKADAVSHEPQGAYSVGAALENAITASEPELATAQAATNADVTAPGTVYVVSDTSTSYLHLAYRSGSDRLCELKAPANGAVDLSCGAAAGPTTIPVDDVAPQNNSLPTISGPYQVAQSTHSTNGSWSALVLGYSYQWQRSPDGSSWTNVPSGGTSAGYTPQAADVGYYLRLVVTAQNSHGSGSAASARSQTPVVGASPQSLTPPVISGTPQVAQTLTTSNGSWSGNPTGFSYQWQRSTDGASFTNVAGATSASYTPQAADAGKYLRVAVQAQNANGQGSATASAVGPILPQGPVSTAPPVISGTPQVAQTLTTSTGSWSGNPTGFSYQWQHSPDGSSWTNVGTDSATYVVSASDANQYLRVVVTAQNAYGSASAASDKTDAVLPQAPINQTPPVISGTPQAGQTLTTSTGGWSGNPTGFSYQWQASTDGSSWTDVSGATAQAYTPTAGQVGQYLRAVVTAQNAYGSTAAASSRVTVLPSAPVNQTPPTISGTAQAGQTLTASTGTWTGNPTGFSYQWQRSVDGTNWANVGTDASTYLIANNDVNYRLRVVVQAANAGGQGAATSDPTAAVLTQAPTATVEPTISGAAQVGQTLTASTGTWTGNPTGFSYQWQRSVDGTNWANVGTDASTYLVPSADLDYYLRVVVQATNSGGTSAANSNSTSKVVPRSPVNQTAPTVSGAAQVGQVLTADPGTWTPSATGYSYQWQRSSDQTTWTNAAGTGAQTSSYTIPSGDVGYYLRVVVQASNAGGSGSATSDGSAQVLAAPANQTPPTVSGSTVQGGTLIADKGTWTGSPTPTYSYQWQSASTAGGSYTNLSGATAASYVSQPSDVGNYLRVCVTATNSVSQTTVCSSSAGPIGPLADSYKAAVLADGPDGYWQLDETSGTTAVDASGHGHPGTYATGAVQGQGGAFTGSRALGSQTAGVAVARNGYFDYVGATPMTLEAWIYPTSTPSASARILTGENFCCGSEQAGYYLSMSGATLNFNRHTGGGGGTTVSYTLPAGYLNQWWHVAATYDGATTQRLYVDGSLVATVNTAGAIASTPGAWVGIGERGDAPTGTYFPGRIDDAAMYGKALSGTRIQAHYAAATASPPSNLSPPTITASGNNGSSETLTAATGAWAPAATGYSYQWQSCTAGGSCVDIAGETSATYALTGADTAVRVVVQATNAYGSGSASSNITYLSTSFPGLVMSTSPSDYWRLDEASGTTFASVTGNSSLLAPATTTGGTAGALVGSSDTAVTKTSSGSLHTSAGKAYTSTGAFSAAGWFYITDNTIASGSNPYLFLNGSGSSGWGLIMNYNCSGTGCLTFYVGGVGSAASGYQIPANQWVYLVVTHDTANNFRLYANGSQVSAATALGAPTAPTGASDAFYVSASVPARVDDVSYWNSTTLGQGFVAKLYSYGASTYAQAVLASAPVGYWRLGSTQTAEDASLNNHGGAWTGAPAAIAGGPSDANKAISFNGSTATVPSTGTAFNFSGTQAFSLEYWIKPSSLAADTTNYHYIIDGYNWTGGRTGWATQINNVAGGQNVTLERWSGGTYNSGYGIPISKLSFSGWNYIVFTYDGAGNVCGYLNGAKDGCWGGATSISSYSVNPTIGGSPAVGATAGYSGGLDELAIYNKALTPTQVSAHWNAR